MFKFSNTPSDEEGTEGLILFISLPDAIDSEWLSKFEVKHCTSLLGINLSNDPEILCAAVYTMNVQLGQFIIQNKQLIGIDSVIVVANKDTVPELSLLDSRHITPIEYVSLFVEEAITGQDNEEHQNDDDHDGTESRSYE